MGAQDLAQQVAVITGFDAVSLQLNRGASGEYAGLIAEALTCSLSLSLPAAGELHNGIADVLPWVHRTLLSSWW